LEESASSGLDRDPELARLIETLASCYRAADMVSQNVA